MIVEMSLESVKIGEETYLVGEWVDYITYLDPTLWRWKNIKWTSPQGVMCEYDAPDDAEFILNDDVFKGPI